jgi:hypothetical protein
MVKLCKNIRRKSMNVTRVTGNIASNVHNHSIQPTKDSKREKQVSKDSNNTDSAAVYESSKDTVAKETKAKTQNIYKRDDMTIEKLKAEAEKRTGQLRSLVEKMLLKQGKTYDETTDIYAFLKSGDYTVDEEVSKQAQSDISEDGYWGVEKTSDRLLSFAKALTGGDPTKIDEMRTAVEKGFADATSAWGGELPSICKDTYDATMKKFDEWEATASS